MLKYKLIKSQRLRIQYNMLVLIDKSQIWEVIATIALARWVAPMRARIVLRRALTTSAQRYLHEREAAQTFPGVMCITLATTQWRRGPGVQTRWGLIRR